MAWKVKRILYFLSFLSQVKKKKHKQSSFLKIPSSLEGKQTHTNTRSWPEKGQSGNPTELIFLMHFIGSSAIKMCSQHLFQMSQNSSWHLGLLCILPGQNEFKTTFLLFPAGFSRSLVLPKSGPLEQVMETSPLEMGRESHSRLCHFAGIKPPSDHSIGRTKRTELGKKHRLIP